ncbi:MAG: serine acetyltransferase [Polyangiaceae bacterium]|nr:serine acetyltransferase [Polyangiaceae bacterium]MCB9608504.1 serine acetyltransferase [Polyangiaceae bacterium]
MSRPTRTAELELAIDDVVASYDGSAEINNLESALLPNRRAVIEAFRHLVPAIYMGFYSTRSLNRDNLRHSVSECLYPAYEILVEQINRAITYEDRVGRLEEPRDAGWSENVVIRLFKELPRLRKVLNSDILAAYDGDPAAKSIEEIVFSYPAVRAITAHRIAHELFLAGVPMLPRIICEHAHGETGIDIHAGARIGERFFIDHGTGVVIGETSDIGNNVKIYQGVTLGALSTRRSKRGNAPLAPKRHPTIEDNVTIYSGATILGGETVIGEGSVIGGNMWITRSVEPNTRLFGRPREGADSDERDG